MSIEVIKKDVECGNGDIAQETVQFQILVQRSSTNKNGVWISLWKTEKGKFVVSRYASEFTDILKAKDNIKDESGARIKYEDSCDENGCSPYPEAKEYYKKKGISLP